MTYYLPSQVNDLERDFRPDSLEVFSELCFSILHFTLRAFEHLIKVGARVKAGVREFPTYGEVKHAKIDLAEAKIITLFKEKLNLDVNQPRDGGKGSSNDGNTARTAFDNPEIFSYITGISVELIKRFDIIRYWFFLSMSSSCSHIYIFYFIVVVVQHFSSICVISPFLLQILKLLTFARAYTSFEMFHFISISICTVF